MAISKEQPMRPALNDCVDFLNNNLGDLNELNGRLEEISGYTLIACDRPSYDALNQAAIQGVTVIRQTPKIMFTSGTWRKNNVRLCWFTSSRIEIAQPQFVATPNNGGFSIECIAKGIVSTISGSLGVGNEWSVE